MPSTDVLMLLSLAFNTARLTLNLWRWRNDHRDRKADDSARRKRRPPPPAVDDAA